jgi:DNA-binding CsgD family transcriptional regulator
MITIPGIEKPEPAAASPVAVGPGPAPARGGTTGTTVGPRPPHGGEPISSRQSAGPDLSGIAAAFAPERSKGPKEAFGLSKRELEVLALIAEGITNREIGERLFISQKTVAVHIGNILSKLGASGRVEAAMVAIRLELVPTPAARRPALA